MNCNSQDIVSEIKNILAKLISELKERDGCEFNERYIHHFFSYHLQSLHPIKFDGTGEFHPEWATAKKGTKRNAKYRKFYRDDKNGSSGFIDFVIGSIETPKVAIEFKCSKSFNKKGAIYDYMKLLDARNKFDTAVSIDIYYCRKSEIRAEYLNNNISEAIERLGKQYAHNRNRYFWTIHIKDNSIIKFECLNKNNEFKIIDNL